MSYISNQIFISDDPRIKTLSSAFFNRSISDVCKNPNARYDTFYSCELKKIVKPYNQHKTGTCWLQAGMSMISTLLLSKNIKIKPSITYLMFYDKLERCEVFYERVVRQNNILDERTHWHLMKEPIFDGGSWSMFVFLLKKYGIVTHKSYPQTYQSKNTRQLNRVLSKFLRISSCRILKLNKELQEEAIKDDMNKIQRILTICLSSPPNTITLTNEQNGFEYSGSPIRLFDKFNEFIDIDSFISLMHAPIYLDKTKSNEFKRYAIFQSNDHTKLQQHIFHVISMENIKKFCKKSLDDNVPVWFTATVTGGADFSRKLMTCDALDYESVFDMNFNITKEELMLCGHVAPSHAMMLIGYDPNWKVRNSWGKKNANLLMSDDWFTNNVFEIVVHKKFVSNVILDMNSEIINLKPWDILSTVAY